MKNEETTPGKSSPVVATGGPLQRSAMPSALRCSEEDTPDPTSAMGPLPRGFLLIFLRRRRAMAITIALFLVGATLYLLKATPQYTSTSKLYVERTSPRILSNSELGFAESTNYLNTQAAVITSPPILGEAARTTNFQQLKCFLGMDNIVSFLKKSLQVDVGNKEDILTVSFESPYPKESAKVVNAVVKSYVEFHSRRKYTTARKILQILEKAKKAREVDLRAKLQVLTEFRKKNNTLAFGNEKKNIILERLIQLSDAVTRAEMEMIAAKATYVPLNDMARKKVDALELMHFRHGFPTEGPAYDEVMTLQEELVELKLKLGELQQNCTNDHPLIVVTRERIQLLSRQRARRIREVVQTQLHNLYRSYVEAKNRYVELNKSFARQKTLAKELNSKSAEYAMLQSEVRRIERLCDELYDRIKDVSLGGDAGSMNISILQVAEASDRASSPRKGKTLVLALIMGFLISVLVAMLLEWVDHTLRSTDEISPLLGVSVLGALPQIAPREHKRPICRLSESSPDSLVAESFRTIRTSLFFKIPEGGKTILITSPMQGEGKSFVSSNLAATMAQAGHKVVLVDADLRKPDLAGNFSVESNHLDIFSVLTGQCTLAEVIRPHPTEPNLHILPCFQRLNNASEVVGSQAFAQVIQTLSDLYDRVLIDSAPILPVADSRIIASQADATILILRAGKSSRKPSEHAVQILRDSGARIVGVVMNDLPVKKSGRYGYGYGYGYGESYGRGETVCAKKPIELNCVEDKV